MSKSRKRLIFLLVASVALSILVNFVLLGPKVSPNARTAMAEALEGVKQRTGMDPRSAMYFQIEYAVTHYTVNHQGRPPQSLSELVPTYFDSIPIDPLTGQPFPPPLSMGGDGLTSTPASSTQSPQFAPPSPGGDIAPGSSIDLSPPCPLGLVRHPTAGVCVAAKKEAATPLPTPTPTPAPVRDSRRG